MVITAATSFIRIFELPKSYPSAFCFNGGHDTIFKLVNWFNPYPTDYFPEMGKIDGVNEKDYKGLPYLNRQPNRTVTLTLEQREILVEAIRDFVRQHSYAQGRKLLAITDYGDSFLI